MTIMMNRDRILTGISLLLAATTATALVQNRRLSGRQAEQAEELARLRAAAVTAAEAAANRPKPAPAPSPRIVTITRDVPASLDTEAERAAYRAEIEFLKAQLEEQSARLEDHSRTNRFGRGDRDGRDRRTRWGEEPMETLRQADPERAREIESLRASFRERIKTDTEDKHAFLSSVDVSHWPPDLQENHAKIMAFYERMSGTLLQAIDGQAPDRDAARELFSQWRETTQQLAAEQDMLLYDTARQIGFDGADADQFVDYIKTIQQVTSPRGVFPSRGGGRPAGPGAPVP